ncbi:uncharacterized protein LOC119358302 [Triticum dicoccoides]|uniref:uncharacterized protein LOC119358302 n=1 Tax=Triticum dicoccoides TaxID=85692 RepID=UPI00188FD841|nr:uncharacterized protein LOC119358302 [Triticum dicoccoides]
MEGVSEEQQSEFLNVVKEIMSLQRERRDLLAALTPGVSVWKRRGLGEEITLVRRLAGKDYTAPVQVQVPEMETEESASTEEQLGRYFDSILQDTEDLSHRMLSMAYAVVNSTSGLMHACKELYEDTHDNEQAEEEQKNTFLDLHDKFLREPLSYENELALVVTREEEEFYEKVVETLKKRAEEVRQHNMLKWKRCEEKEKERERYYTEKKMGSGKDKEIELRWKKKREKEQEEREKKDKEEDEREKKEMATMEYLKKRMEVSEEFFADHRDGWETGWGSKSVRCGDFRDKTTLSPMHFTHYTPNTIRSSCGVTGSTLQIYSMQILELKKGLNWPLKLYGVVAARDSVDRNRNIVFSRSSLNSQELNENGSSLCLTGPARAIVALGPVDFEIELKIEEGEESQDKELITLSKRYDGTDEVVADADEIVLLDCRGDDEVRVGSDGYLHLSRNVVSVQSQGTMVVVIRTYLESGHAAQDSKVEFPAKLCQTSESECSVGNSKVKIVVAWSLLVKEKQDLLVDCPAVEP